ncbi:MAG: hypothetical protein Q7S03_00900 [bacterium]|nr:hypothetical protein [bacterium]
MRQKGTALIFILVGVMVIARIVIGVYYLTLKNMPQKPAVIPKAEVPKNLFPYKRPSIPAKRAYLTFLVGDSIIAALGKNADQLRKDLIANYPAHEFVNYNYGFGSTNILTLPDRLNNQTTYLGETFPPINEQTFDLIIFESFAYNPLSQYPLEEGLKKQTEILDMSIKEVIEKHPNSVVAIMVPIAPSEKFFAKGIIDLTIEVRKQWVKERVAYIKNAIEFAQKNNIPLINVYEKSLTAEGTANLKYINPSDYIHPSNEGIKLISKTIADYIFQNQIFPE